MGKKGHNKGGKAKPAYMRDPTEEIAELERRIAEESPRRGWCPGADESAARFDALPLSSRTLQGLTSGGFETMKPIQRCAIPHALAGRDVLGAADRLGKTLAFVPALEALYRHRWSAGDGLGALIISPTRELAAQIFDVLRKAGRARGVSAGLITARPRLRRGRDRVGRMCLLVATPGRVLQHAEESPAFDARAARAHRGIRRRDERALVAGAAGEASQPTGAPTPKALDQCRVTCGLEEKMDARYAAFVKAHLKCKTIVFVSSCAQARFLLEALRGTQPGVPLLALHGKQSQGKRTATFEDYKRKTAAVLFATDVAARGLDVPDVDWVVQLDAPEDAEAYVHRAGRAARNGRPGKAMLVLLPSEERMAELLAAAKIPVKKVAINGKRTFSAAKHVEALVAARPEVKALAQKCFSAYVRSVVLAADKALFDASKLPLKAFATSLGLANAPRKLKEQIAAAKAAKRGVAAAPATAAESSGDDDSDDDVLVSAGGPERGVGAIEVAAVDKPLSRKKARKQRIDGAGEARSSRATKLAFDDDGRSRTARGASFAESGSEGGAQRRAANADFVDRVRARLAETDGEDRAREGAPQGLKLARKAKRKRPDDDAATRAPSPSSAAARTTTGLT
ncbi:box C/D snoRNA binding protein [Aureococcus anophagefferens]|nr:box C/D snoRNA binding protein [Aureococcus anophagefferens]